MTWDITLSGFIRNTPCRVDGIPTACDDQSSDGGFYIVPFLSQDNDIVFYFRELNTVTVTIRVVKKAGKTTQLSNILKPDSFKIGCSEGLEGTGTRSSCTTIKIQPKADGFGAEFIILQIAPQGPFIYERAAIIRECACPWNPTLFTTPVIDSLVKNLNQ